MRVSALLLLGSLCVVAPAPVLAYENFIPAGTSYSSTVDSLPDFASPEGQIIQQADIYETENYKRGRKRVEDDSRFRQFFSDGESTGVNGHIDY